WIYDIDIGEVMAYDPERHAYVPPQDMLPPEEQDVELDTTAAACALPLSGTAPAPTISRNNGATAAPVAASYSRDVIPSHQRFPFVYMSSEQADRIYRGSSN
ncbi:MAG: hypothetical protein AAFY26_27940, partial [Cyanobacteria bacterium J06638_22]